MSRRVVIFIVVSILILPIGCWIVSAWEAEHPNQAPETGFYHGKFRAIFSDYNARFSLNIEGRSSAHWYWRRPDNFTYATVEVFCWDRDREMSATVSIPEFIYYSEESTGAFTKDILAQWLYGNSAASNADKDVVGVIFAYFEQAAHGALPRPRHHTYYLEKPVIATLQHFLGGFGVPIFEWIWIGAWMTFTPAIGFLLLRLSSVRKESSPT